MPKALTEGFHRHSIADGIMRADNIRPYDMLNIQILYIFCLWSDRGLLPRHSWCTPLSNAPPERSPAARLFRPAERRLNPAGVGGYLQLNVQILYIFCILFNEFTAGFNIIAH